MVPYIVSYQKYRAGYDGTEKWQVWVFALEGGLPGMMFVNAWFERRYNVRISCIMGSLMVR